MTMASTFIWSGVVALSRIQRLLRVSTRRVLVTGWRTKYCAKRGWNILRLHG